MAESETLKLRTGDDCKKIIIDAIRDKNVKEIELIIEDLEKSGQDLASVVNCDHHSRFQDCILLIAIKTKKADLVDLLLGKGLCTEDPKIQDRLIHQAILMNDLSVMQTVNKHGLLHQSVCSHGTPPLFQLVALQRLTWIQLFYRAGVSFKEKNRKGQTLLHFALRQRFSSKRLIRLLLYWGVDLDEKDEKDLTPLHFLAYRHEVFAKNKSFAKILLRFGANLNAWSEPLQQNVLETAIDRNQPELVQILLMYGAKLKVQDKHECKALKHFVSKGCEFGISVIVKEYIRLVCINEVVDPKHSFLLKELGNYYYIYGYLIDELVRIKTACRVDALDIIMANEIKLTRSMKNPKMSEFIDSLPDSASNENHCWSDILRFRAKKGKERAILMKMCEQPFREIVMWDSAPIVVVDKIFSYLSHHDLLRFYTAFYPASYLERLLPKKVKPLR